MTAARPWHLDPSIVFDMAAELIEAKGWFQGMRDTGSNCHCALTAIEQVLAGTKFNDDTREAELDSLAFVLSRRLGLTDQRPVSAIIDWNDADGRTKDEVISTLRAAAREVA